MHTNRLKTEQDVIDALKRGRHVMPSELSFKSAIQRLDLVSKGYRRTSAWRAVYAQAKLHYLTSYALCLFLVALMIGTVIQYKAASQTVASGVSNASLADDLQAVDAQLGGLDADIANINIDSSMTGQN